MTSSVPKDLVWDAAALPDRAAFAVLEHVAHPLFVKDRAFRFVLLNSALARLVGFPRDAMLGKTDYDFFPRAEADFFRKTDQAMFESGTPVQVPEEIITDAAGKKHVLSTTKVPLRDATGAVTHMAGIIHDITAIKEAQAVLQESKEALEKRVSERTRALADTHEKLWREERLALVGRLVSGLASQLRNPLGAILNTVALLKRAPDVLPAEALRVLEEEAWAASRTLGELGEVMGERGEPVTVRVFELVDHVLTRARLPVTVRVERVGMDASARVDTQQTVTALLSLVNNAVEAMNGNGTLTFEVEASSDRVFLRVRDTGPGVKPEAVPNLFVPTRSDKPQDHGLGLTMARLLIESQKGSLLYVPGGPGARFDVTLPKG
jgi:PAS domain S-box-containing protein